MLTNGKKGNKTLKGKVSPKEILEFQKDVSDHWTLQRVEIIRLASEGYNNLEIQEITGINEKNIRYWIGRFNDEGFSGLLRRKTISCTGKLTSEEIEYIKEILKNPPSLFGYKVYAWTVKLVWDMIQKLFGVKYHQRHIYTLIKRIGFKIAKPYPFHIKRDEKEIEKFNTQVLPAMKKKKEQFEKKGRKVIILAQDETHVRVEYPNIRIVCPSDEKPIIKANWNKNLKTSIHGCIDNDGKWTITQEISANKETFCRFLDKAVENYPEYQVYMMMVDGAKYHKADLIREHIYDLRSQGKNIKLVPFPKYSPDFNPIEQEWRPFKRGIHNKIITVMNELTSAVNDGLEALSTASKGLLSNYFPMLFG